MKPWKIVLLVVLGILLCSPLCASAETQYTYEESLVPLLNATGMQELLEEQALEDMLSEQGVSLSEPETLTGFSFTAFLGNMLDQLSGMFRAPLKLLASISGIILFTAFVTSLRSSRSTLSELYEMICTLCVVGILSQPFREVLLHASQALERSAGFMLSFSAIFGAVLTVSGGITTAAAYQTAMVALCQLAMQLAANVMLPLLSMCMAMGIVDAANPSISLEGMVRLVHKITVWLLGFLMAVFLGFLSIQSMVSLSADHMSSKTSKYVISNAIPFVGGAVSDAYSAVLGSLGVLRSSTGMIGVLSLLVVLLPMLLQLGVYRLVTAAAAAIADLFAAGSLARLLKTMECVLSTAFSIAVSFSVMFVVSTAIMLMLASGLQLT